MACPEEIQQEAHIRVVSKNLYAQGREPVSYGVLDRRMVSTALVVNTNVMLSVTTSFVGCKSERYSMYYMQSRTQRMCRSFWLPGSCIARIPCWSLSCDYTNSSVNLQGD